MVHVYTCNLVYYRCEYSLAVDWVANLKDKGHYSQCLNDAMKVQLISLAFSIVNTQSAVVGAYPTLPRDRMYSPYVCHMSPLFH